MRLDVSGRGATDLGGPEKGVHGYSHGLCAVHGRLAFEQLFRKLQLKEGNPDMLSQGVR